MSGLAAARATRLRRGACLDFVEGLRAAVDQRPAVGLKPGIAHAAAQIAQGFTHADLPFGPCLATRNAQRQPLDPQPETRPYPNAPQGAQPPV